MTLLDGEQQGLPWSTVRDTVLVVDFSGVPQQRTSAALGLYVPHKFLSLASLPTALRQDTSSKRILVLVDDSAPQDSLRELARHFDGAGVECVVLAAGHPDLLSGLLFDCSVFYTPAADAADWRNLCAAPFGAIDVLGRLPKATARWALGTGERLAKTRFAPVDPATSGVDLIRLTDIDAIVNTAVAANATPGAQVSVIYRGQLIYDKAFGALAPGERAVRTDDLYDLASLTKTTGTTIAGATTSATSVSSGERETTRTERPARVATDWTRSARPS